MEYALANLNNSKIFAGCTMLLMNIGGKYIATDLPKSLDKIFSNIWVRRFVIFCIAFIATRDIKISIFITLIFIIVFTILLNENSMSCILPKEYKSTKITQREADEAKKTLEKYIAEKKKLIKKSSDT